jgi:hypothetical protein
VDVRTAGSKQLVWMQDADVGNLLSFY